jgi:hypothetical protein
MERLADIIKRIVEDLIKPKPTVEYLSGKTKPKPMMKE